MSRSVSISFSAVGGTGAGLGRSAEGRTLLADRPAGVAGGGGLGFNGAELLAAALGGCFWNDLHYAAHEIAPTLTITRLDARVDLAGQPPRVVRAAIVAELAGAHEDDLARVFEAAASGSTISSSLRPAFPIALERVAG